ncbi:hypothetical protein KCP91_15695 [Microvirga sp. SRT01]|uniref:Acyl-CoA dehydrogenase/oxidase C-terminal domain-containing protein n=1 Tax=Sphingomonas longa TaxID=2778730 RepID=A0ABS2DA53_9SPHN|nr:MULTISPECIES: acyl-CoA dehydrogenase family protein [Alphaproteobacteria]MBM6577827.1 hypothetical protein [Sphingomonas sp. BT552]MBR7710869.1 hypothetical protein [Microvirga sp. SRT01]
MSDLLEMMLDQTDRLFGDHVDRQLLVEVEQGGWPSGLWAQVEAFGLPDALIVPAQDGGLSFAEAGALFASLGRHVVPLPVGETMLARMMLARAGVEAPVGPIALAAGGDQAFAAQGVGHVLVQRDGRWALEVQSGAALGSIARVPYAVAQGGKAIATHPIPDGLPDLLTLGAMLRASQMAGAVARVLEMAVDYANTRQQFGRPIGRFQAVQQLLARLAAEAAAGQAASDMAWSALDAGTLDHAGAIAKIRAGEAARIAATIGHQVHGAIGVTDEHMLHYVTRRLWTWRLEYGSERAWATRLGEAARREGDLWSFLTTRCGAAALEQLA